MKNKMFQEILDEEWIEVNKSVSETIHCLREQSGSSRHFATSDDMRIYFGCSKKGKITVETNIVGFYSSDVNMLSIYHVNGEVLSKDGKTYVKITSVYKKSDLIWRGILMALITLMIPVLTILALVDGTLNLVTFIGILLSCFVGMALIIGHTETRKTKGKEWVAIMEQEIKSRVQSVARWDD